MTEKQYGPTQESIIQIYDGWMSWPLLQEYYNRSRFMNVGYWSDDTLDQHAASRALVDYLMGFFDHSCTRLLDVGCGQGAAARYINDNYPIDRVDAINNSRSQLEQARLFAPNATFRQMSATNLDYPDNTFDAITCIEAAFHFDTRIDFFCEANRVLVPGGILVLTDMLFSSFGPLENALIPRANQSVTLANYEDMVASAGFANCKVHDITSRTWSTYTQRFSEWVENRFRDGMLSSAELSIVQNRLVALNVQNYIAVAAEKE